MSLLPITAEVFVNGVRWSALLVPLTTFEVRRNGALVPATWDRQTVQGSDAHAAPLRALTRAMRAAISEQEKKAATPRSGAESRGTRT